MGTFLDNVSATCQPQQQGPSITVDATKVVCTDPSQLPHWGSGAADITASTAQNWVNAHNTCSIVPGWTFEYGNQNAANGGDNTVGHVAGYTAFTGTTQISLAGVTEVHMREQNQTGYIPFTYTADPSNQTYPSAQFYCADDVLNNDNWDFIRNPVAGSTYYCVGFNAPTTQTPPQECVATNTPESAATVVTSDQGLRKDGSAVLATRSDPSAVLGAHDTNFYSLGFGGSITMSFAAPVANVSGNDFELYEVTNKPYPLETALVEVSQDGNTWHTLSQPFTNTGTVVSSTITKTGFDFSSTGLASIQYVRVTDQTNPALHTNDADGIDLESAQAVSSCQIPDNGGGQDTSADVGITKTIQNEESPELTGTVTYVLTVTNHSATNAATDVTVTDVIPTAQLEGISTGSPSLGTASYETPSHTVTWTIPSIPANGTATLNVTATVMEDGTIANTATVTSDNDSNSEDNSSTVSFDSTTTQSDPGPGPDIVTTFGSNGGSYGGDGSNGPTPEVLGASCGLTMNQHLRIGSSKNLVDQVKILQGLLNKYLGLTPPLPITGHFGPLTEAAVKAFQAKYADDILSPWGISSPTGLVYLSTLYWINHLECPDLAGNPPSSLIPWSQNSHPQ